MGDDGFGYGAFAQYNSFNTIVWPNDPDHIEFSQPDAFRAATLTSLTGSVQMLTDPPELCRTPRVEAARRAAPVLFARPALFYDVDPSRSSQLARVATELSGSGPRPADADQRLTVPLYLLDVATPFEQWHVLARTGGDEARLAFADLGLATGREYLVFEFWTQACSGPSRTGPPRGRSTRGTRCRCSASVPASRTLNWWVTWPRLGRRSGRRGTPRPGAWRGEVFLLGRPIPGPLPDPALCAKLPLSKRPSRNGGTPTVPKQGGRSHACVRSTGVRPVRASR